MANGERREQLKRYKHFAKEYIREIFSEEAPGVAYSKGIDISSIAKMRDLTDRVGLSGLLNYESYNDEEGLYYNTDSISFMLAGSPSGGLSEGELRVLNGIFTQQHKPGTTIQVTLMADPNIRAPLKHWEDSRIPKERHINREIFAAMAQRRSHYISKGRWSSIFTGQSFLFRDYHLIISYNVPVPDGIKAHEVDKADIEEIRRMRESFEGILKSAKIFLRSLGPERFINLMYSMLNPSDEDQPYFRYDDNTLLRQQIFDSETLFLTGRDGSSLVRGDKNISVLPWSVKQYPQRWSGSANGEIIGSSMDDILRMPCPFIFTQTVYVPDQISQGGMVKRKTMRATQMSDSPIAKFVPQWLDRKADWDYVTKKMADGNKLLESSYQVVLFAQQGQEEFCEQSMKSIYQSLGWTMQKDRFIPLHGVLAALPMWPGRENNRELVKLKRYRSMLSWNIVNTSPWIAEYKGTSTSTMLLAGRRGQLAFMDNFDNREGNFNIAVAAASGAGKSFVTSEFCYSQLSAGGRGFIIDSGRSYERLCGLFHGSYLDFNPENNIVVNPFTHLKDIDEGMPLLMMLVQEMAGIDTKDALRKAMIERAVRDTWEEFENAASITRIRNILEKHEDRRARDIATALFPFTEGGRFARYFEGESTIQFDNDLVVLELDDLSTKPELQSIVLLILMFNITQAFYQGDRKQRKFCIIDEAWRLLAKGSGAAGEFIEEGYRVARKYGGCFMTITQRIADYYKSDVAQAAYANSDWTWLLRQKTEDLIECRENGWLNCDHGRFELYNSLRTDQGKYSEIAMVAPGGVSAFRFVVDPFAEKLYSTKAEEYEYIADKVRQGASMVDAIDSLVEKTRGHR